MSYFQAKKTALLAAALWGLAVPGASAQQSKARQFTLLLGGSAPVCNAYLQRINIAEYKVPAPCERPETGEVAGFARLKHVELTTQEFRRLHKGIDGFLAAQNPSYWDNLNKVRAERGLAPAYRDTDDPGIGRREMPYRLEPAVDIDNDGVKDQVLIWKGHNECGGLYPQRRLETRYALVLSADGSAVDVTRTRRLFAHPKAKDEIRQGLPAYFQGVTRNAWDIDVLGHAFGVFEYAGITYFDTFLGARGDTNGKSLPGDGNFKTLSVFLHQKGATTEVCRYRWNDPGNSVNR